MNIRTRKLILALFFFSGAVSPGMCGVNLGMTGAVKNKVKELDKKVGDKAAASLLVGGTAATGQAIANALVELRACDGRVQTSTTAVDGSFQFNAAGYSFPLLLRVASGTTHYFSLAGAAGTANIHPFTDLVMRTYFRSARGVSDADAAYAANSAAICAPAMDTLAPMKMVVTNVVSPVLLRNTVDPDTYDLFTTPFAANGAGFDRVLDETRVVAGTAFSTVTVRDTFSNVVLSTITSGLSDTAIPAAPTNLTAAAVTHSSITLTWTLSVSTNVAGYAILRNGSRIAVSSAGAYADLGVSPGVQYSYTVKAFTWTGNYSLLTPVTQVTTLGYLAVTKLGSGTGTVTSAPAGIQCGSACSAEFPAGTQVTLTATAEIGSAFTGWSGGVCSGTGTCTVTLGGASVSARFVSAYLLFLDGTVGGAFTTVPPGIYCHEPREGHIAVLLSNGKVLVAGGYGLQALVPLPSADLYNPSNGTWFATGSMSVGRVAATATLLNNGKVLIVGGNSYGSGTAVVELYDPATGTWSTTGSLATARMGHTATLLPNGKVLVTGGAGNLASLTSAELYDPATGSWSATGSMVAGRYGHSATLLPNGKVLVAGGWSNVVIPTAELYDPATGNWAATGTMSSGRYGHISVLLATGKVLLAGGEGATGQLRTALLYNPATGLWATTGSMTAFRSGHTATLLSNGKVLVAGGNNSSALALSSAELYNPAAGTWAATGAMGNPLKSHAATLMTDGKVLVTGLFRVSDLYSPTLGTWSKAGYPCAGYFPEGGTVVVTPVGDLGFVFYEWGAGACTGNGTCSVSMDGAEVITGVFRSTHLLTVSKVGSGTVTSSPSGISCGATCEGSFVENTVSTLTATAAAGYIFTGWSGGCSGSNPVCYVTMEADKTVVATFTRSYVLTVSKVGSGTVTSYPDGIDCGTTCAYSFAEGTSATLTATPAVGQVFSGWSGSGCSGTGVCNVTVDAAKTVTATFVAGGGGGIRTTITANIGGAPKTFTSSQTGNCQRVSGYYLVINACSTGDDLVASGCNANSDIFQIILPVPNTTPGVLEPSTTYNFGNGYNEYYSANILQLYYGPSGSPYVYLALSSSSNASITINPFVNTVGAVLTGSFSGLLYESYPDPKVNVSGTFNCIMD